MRFIHTSDWHLGRILHGIHLTYDQAYILDEFVKVIKDTKPDAIVISGDIYDRSVPPVEAVELLDDVFTNILLDFNIPILAISGNHDSADRLNFGSRLLKNKGLYITGKLSKITEPVEIDDAYGSICFYSLPYCEPIFIKSIANNEEISSHDDAMKAATDMIRGRMDRGKRNVLITHAFVAGGTQSESERPLSVGGSGSVDPSCFQGFNYTALGHLHAPQKAGGDNIRYSGSLMKYSFSEVNQKKCLYIIDMDGQGNCSIEPIELIPKRDLRCIKGKLNDIVSLASQSSENCEDYILAELTDEGPILDPIGKLRKVYPNVLRIEREALNSNETGKLRSPGREYNKMSELELFKAFYREVTKKEFTSEKEDALVDLMKEFYSSKGADA